jgi:hypothetical protein
MSKLIFALLFILVVSLQVKAQYTITNIGEAGGPDGYRTFDMNNQGNIVFLGADSFGITQIFLFADGNLQQITFNSNDNITIQPPVMINNNNEMVWRQIETNYDLNKINWFVMRSDQFGNVQQISGSVTEWFNYCHYPSINDAGQVVWMQYGEDHPVSYIFLYENGTANPIYEGGKEIGFTHINQNGYVLYESKNTPEFDWSIQAFLWDNIHGHRRVCNQPEGESAWFPYIDNNNNVYFQLYGTDGYAYYRIYSVAENTYYDIDIAAKGSFQDGHFNEGCADNGNFIFSGINDQIYLYDRITTQPLTNENINTSPTIQGNWKAWISDLPELNGRITLTNGTEVRHIDSLYATSGLDITADGNKVLIARLNIFSFSLYLAEYGTTSVMNPFAGNDKSTIHVYPNPVSDLLQLNWPVEDWKSLKLYDVSGRQLPIPIDCKALYVSRLSSGVYLLRSHKHQARFVVTR